MTKISRFTSHISRHSPLLLSIFLFLLAFTPRALDLGRFLTADEFLWADRSRNFLAGLTNPAYPCESLVEKWGYKAQGLACTLRTGHPGVTTMWSGSLGFVLRWLADGRPAPLHDYVVAVSTNPLDAGFIAPERLGVVLVTSLGVAAFFWLARRLWGSLVALAGAMLLALDPFHIALSRVIHHDALSTTFMTLSALCALIYWGERTGRRWLLLSGILGGLAFISKLSSLFLMPFIALTGLWFFVEGARMKAEGGRLEIKRFLSFILSPLTLILCLDGLLWFAVAIAAVFIFWPAMWVAPLETLQVALSLGIKYSTGAHAKGVFFLGQSMGDPGVLFYPITWLYRASPLVLVGVIGWLGGEMVRWLPKGWLTPRLTGKEQTVKAREPEAAQPSAFSFQPSFFMRYLPLLLLFILGYYLLMTIGEKKQERYFLPAYPWLDLIAAAGLLCVTCYGSSMKSYVIRLIQYAILLLIILVNGLLVVLNFPYYFTYYNPLLGGIQGAAKVVTIGWGEGLDLAADYLNHKPDPAHTRVASWYESTFTPFYHGPTISYSKEKGKALAGDYVIFYINQTQRRYPDDIFFDYFEQRFKPDKVITLHGLDYAWIYPSLGVDHYVADQTYEGMASLLAWRWTKGDRPLLPGQTADFELYWEYLGKQPGELFFFRLVDAQGRPCAAGVSQPAATENPPLAQWRIGEIILERGALTLPADMPPGQYRLQIGFYTKAPAVTEGELRFILPSAESLVTVDHSPAVYALPAAAVPVNQSLGAALTLLGAVWPNKPAAPGSHVPLDLYWQIKQPLPADSKVHIALADETGVVRQAWFNLTLAETFNPAQTTWQPGDIIHTRWQLDLRPDTPPGAYRWQLVLPQNTAQTLSVGELRIGEK